MCGQGRGQSLGVQVERGAGEVRVRSGVVRSSAQPQQWASVCSGSVVAFPFRCNPGLHQISSADKWGTKGTLGPPSVVVAARFAAVVAAVALAGETTRSCQGWYRLLMLLLC